MVSHDHKSYIAPHCDHLDLSNANGAIDSATASASYITLPKQFILPLILIILTMRNAVKLLKML